jgi:hypothetical protein
MAFITLSGTLLDPNGDLAVGDQIRFTHKSTTGETVESAVSLITVDPAGAYSLPLQYGLVLVEYKDVRTQQFKNLGVATVNQDNPATSIPELLNALVPASSAELIEFQAILADCVTAQTAAENAATTAEAFAYQLTTTDLIASTATFAAATNIPTSGFTTSGDGGNGSWKQNGITGQTPSQSPAQLGDALLNDGNGNQWAFVGKALFVEQLGGVLDGVTDNTLIKDAILAWSQTSGGNVYIGNGVFLTGTTGLTSKNLKIFGLGRHLSEWKLKDGENNNAFSLTGTGKLTAKHLTINQNRDNQTGGHGIRAGGCEKLLIEDVTIKNCYSYGIGSQAGTNIGVSLSNLTIHDVGQDGIDIKDYNLNNGVIFIDGYTCYNYDLLGVEQQVGLDVRGTVIATKVNIITNGNNYGVRFRVGGTQGRAGAGSITGLDVTSSDTAINSIALDLPTESSNFTISNITVDGVGLAIRQAATGVGGVISNLTAKNLIGTDCLSFAGSDLIVNGLIASNAVSSSRIIDFEPGASNIQISNFLLTDNSGNASAGRVQATATNIALQGGVVKGGAISDAGTATIQDNVRLL